VSEELVQALEIGRRDQARLLAQRLSRAAPEHADALVAVGAWHLHEQRLSDADRMFGEASYRRPSNARRLAVLQALLWSRQHRFADAIRKLDELPLASLDSRALATLAECCRRTGQRGRAQKLAEQCLTQDASATQARAVLWYLAAEGDKVAPLAEAQEVLAQNPSDASALYFMADQLWSKTRTEALKLARRAAEADPLHPGAGDWSERLELGAHTPRRGNALTLVGLYAPKQDAGGAWPTPDQARLLELVFETPSDIVGAWNEWVSGQDIQDLDAGFYRLLPLAYRRLAEAGGSEASHFQLLAGIWRKSHYDNYNRWRKILPVLDRLIEDGVPLMPLKGGLFAAQLYADWGSRPMADIDLLVPLSHVDQAHRLIKEAGLTSQPPLSPERVSFHYALNYKEPSGSTLDLHWRPMEEMVRPDYADDVVWNDSEPMMLLGRTFRKPSPTFQVVHAIVHGLRWNHVAPVRWVADAVLLLRAHGGSVDWRAAEDLARRFHFLLPLQKGLEYILHNFSVDADAIHASNILKAKPDAIEAPLFSIRLNGQRHRCSHHEMMTLANHYKPLVAASPRTTLLLIGGAQADLTRQWCARNKVPWLPEFEKTKVLQLLRAQGLKGAHCVHGNMNGKYAYQICA
jgi:tetratricopeptide (TPR) repeat protein